MSAAAEFAKLPPEVRDRVYEEAAAAFKVAEFWDLKPAVRKEVYENAVDAYYEIGLRS